MKRILVIGAGGQIGTELVPHLQKHYGEDNVIGADLKDEAVAKIGTYARAIKLDALDFNAFGQAVKDNNIDAIFNLVALLSATGEKNPDSDSKSNPDSDTTCHADPAAEAATPRRRRLYRDPDNCILGGVASGIAHYIGIDVVVVRVILVLLLPLWASSIWIYLLLWICVPEARTTAQKLEMRGETPNIDNIRRAVEEEQGSSTPTGSALSHTLGEIFRGIFKVFFIGIGALIALSIIGALVTCIVSLLSFLFLGSTAVVTPFISIFPGHIDAVNGHWELILLTVSLLLTFGIPLYAILRLVLGSIFHWKSQSTALNIFLSVLWLLSLAGLFFATFVAIPGQELMIL